MAKISSSERKARSAALINGRYSPERIATELKRRHFAQWEFDDQRGQTLILLDCGVRITCYKNSGSVLVQGSYSRAKRVDCVEHLKQILPSYTAWQLS